MQTSIADTVVHALPANTGGRAAAGVDLGDLTQELERVAHDALDARMQGIPLSRAAIDDRFPHLGAFHRGLRDSLLMEIPRELQPWVAGLSNTSAKTPRTLHRELFEQAHGQDVTSMDEGERQLRTALAEVLLFESIRLRLLVEAWSSTDFESVGGDDEAVDEIAWTEVEAMLQEPEMAAPDIRPIPVMIAAGSVALAQDAATRAQALLHVGADEREELVMRARLRSALRDLRLPESVLLENALSNLLGEERHALVELQEEHPVALEGMSRQAMDQRVSRGRRALSSGPENWPSRRNPALFDLLRSPGGYTRRA